MEDQLTLGIFIILMLWVLRMFCIVTYPSLKAEMTFYSVYRDETPTHTGLLWASLCRSVDMEAYRHRREPDRLVSVWEHPGEKQITQVHRFPWNLWAISSIWGVLSGVFLSSPFLCFLMKHRKVSIAVVCGPGRFTGNVILLISISTSDARSCALASGPLALQVAYRIH